MILHSEKLIKYKYRVYGLNIISDIIIPELLSKNNNEFKYPDVTIILGELPEKVQLEIEIGHSYKFKKNEMWFSMKGIARYYIYKGNTIIVQPYPNAKMEDVKILLLGSAFGMLLIQKNMVAIHGGTVVVNGQGLIITGCIGAGKSTLISAFRREGHTFLADDVSALGKDENGSIIIHPTYPQTKLCRDAMEKMGYNPNDFMLIDSYKNKYAIPLNRSFLDYTVVLNVIYEICISDVTSVEITEILGSEKIRLILRNIYRMEITQNLGLDPQYFKQCMEIAKYIPVYRIRRPRNGFTVNEQIKLIKDTLKTIRENVI